MLAGRFGEGLAEAMKVQVALGEAFDAERMVEISRAHEAVGTLESSIRFLELLAKLDAHCQVPTTCNPMIDADYLESIGIPIPQEEATLIKRAKEARRKIGVIPTYSCTPCQQDNPPRINEIVAYAESSATCYANSVCGARSHRESANSALAAAVTGRVPVYGFLLTENRRGDILVKVEATLRDDFDYHILGYAIGKEAGVGVPVFTDIASLHPSPEDLASLGAELAVSGAVTLFHVVGVTPQAPDLETVFGGKTPEKQVTVTDADLLKTQESISHESGKINFVMFGCPHYNLIQVRDVARLLEGKTISKDVELWVLTSFYTKELARQMGYLEIINKAGGHITVGTCPDRDCWSRLYEGKVGITDSPKAAYYIQHRGINFIIKRRSECIEAALRGGC